MTDINSLTIPELEDLIEAKIKALDKRNKAIEAARRMEKDFKRNT